MSIAPAQQGKGYARAALGAARLHPLLRAHFPDGGEIVLGVNHANHAAIALYQRCGFSDSGRTYMGVKGVAIHLHPPGYLNPARRDKSQ